MGFFFRLERGYFCVANTIRQELQPNMQIFSFKISHWFIVYDLPFMDVFDSSNISDLCFQYLI